MESRTNRETEELEIKLTEEETKRLYRDRWVYDHDEDIMVLLDKDSRIVVFKNISTKTPYYWRVKMAF